MKTIGLVVAIEIDSVLTRYGAPQKEYTDSGFEIKEYKSKKYKLIVVQSKVGEIAAAGATQLLISKYKVDVVLNFGVVGGLTPEMKVAKLCVAQKVAHYDFDTTECDPERVVGQYYADPDSRFVQLDANLLLQCKMLMPEIKLVTVASGDKFVGNEAKKRELSQIFGADVCDMELAGIALTCERANVPCLSIKCVADSLTHNAGDYKTNFAITANKCFELCDKVLNNLK